MEYTRNKIAVKAALNIVTLVSLVFAYANLIESYITLLQYHPYTSPVEHNVPTEPIELGEIPPVRITCFILTGPDSHRSRSIHVKQTWGQRCNRLLFVSTRKDDLLDTIVVENVREGRNWLWAKTRRGLKYIWENHKDETDWILKADDNTYVIMENLRRFLADKDPSKPHYYGCRMKWYVQQGVHFGGSGYVISKETLRMFMMDAYSDSSICRQKHHGDEDGELGKCLAMLGIPAEDTRDEKGRHRFLYSAPETYLHPNNSVREQNPGHLDDLYYPLGQGFDCCSDSLISFHEMTPEKMYAMEYLIYHIKRGSRSK